MEYLLHVNFWFETHYQEILNLLHLTVNYSETEFTYDDIYAGIYIKCKLNVF